LIFWRSSTHIPASNLPIDPAPFFREGSHDEASTVAEHDPVNPAARAPWFFPSRIIMPDDPRGIGRSAWLKEVADLRDKICARWRDMGNLASARPRSLPMRAPRSFQVSRHGLDLATICGGARPVLPATPEPQPIPRPKALIEGV